MATYTDRLRAAWAALANDTRATAQETTGPRAALPAGRQSTTAPGSNPLGGFGWATAARVDRARDWRARGLDSKTLDKIDTSELVELLADVSPEVSSALWHFVRFANPGYEINAYKVGTKEPDPKAQALLDDLLKKVSARHGAANVLIDQYFITAFLRGALMGEVILDDKRKPVSLVAVDPMVAEYKERNDPILGPVWELGQKNDRGKFISLDYPTIRYVPIDPLPGYAPYGRAMLSPAVFVAVFLIGILHDLRRVIQQQGYPRIDLSINLEQLRAALPPDQKDNIAALKSWANQTLNEVQTAYNALQPDDAFLHTSVVNVGGPVGTVDARSLGAIDGIIKALERMIIRGLKAMPLALGSHDGATETYANRAWEIHAATIKSIQHLAETMLQDLLTVALEAQGVAAAVEVKFAELRASEELRDAQTAAMRIGNAAAMYDRGWISQDEAAMLVTGSAADHWRPRFVSLQGSLDIVDLAVSGSDEIAALNVAEESNRQAAARNVTRGQLIGEVRRAIAQLDRLTEAPAQGGE